MGTMYLIVAGVLALGIGIGFVLGKFLRVHQTRKELAEATRKVHTLLAEAEKETESFRQGQLLQAKREWEEQRKLFEKKVAEARRALRKTKEKLDQRQGKLLRRTQKLNDRELMLHRAAEALEVLRKEAEKNRDQAECLRRDAELLLRDVEARQRRLEQRESEVERLQTELSVKNTELDRLINEHIRKLEEVAGLTREAARQMLMDELIEEARLEASSIIKNIREEARLQANREATKIILNTIQRTASSTTVENTVAMVELPSDEMKGRIIGKEGRNIRAFEAATGIEVIVDDTPEAVILSGFDPVRREIARLAMERLIQDGRIHPARIEDVVEKVRAEIEQEIIETGESTVIELGLHGLHPELIRLIGRMRYRTSYGQNLLAHSIEVAKLASLMAAELGLDAYKARRAGLLHDIGKVVEGDLESPHALVGMELCEQYGEDPEVCNAVGAHHDEIEMTSLISPIVQAADAISGSRPGARRESLENYIKRLKKLEELAGSFEGVEKVYAIQAGREVRVIVNHSLISDTRADQLASDIARKIQQEVQYPGQIKVVVIREKRAVSYAK